MCAEVNVYLADPAAYLAASKKAGDTTARTNLENVLTALQHDHCTTFLECLTVARKCAPLPCKNNCFTR